jgi:hypothetical protein
MSKRLVLLILVFLVSVVSARSGFDAGPVKRKSPDAIAVAPAWISNAAGMARHTLLRDGFVLRSIDGKLNRQDSPAPIREPQAGREPKLNGCESGWFFELGSDVSDYRVLLKAGTRLELLPSATLEKMTADVNERSVRLWGRVTKYKGQNFIFPMYFLPLSKTAKPQSQISKALQKSQQQEGRPVDNPSAGEGRRERAISGPNDILEIPQEIIEKLKTRRAKTAHSGQRMADSERLQDDGRLVFVLDALGRKVQQVSLRLLPCEALELTEARQSAAPEPVRFKIAGIRTEYKGKHYLLLQKATRVYSHQNFDR